MKYAIVIKSTLGMGVETTVGPYKEKEEAAKDCNILNRSASYIAEVTEIHSKSELKRWLKKWKRGEDNERRAQE